MLHVGGLPSLGTLLASHSEKQSQRAGKLQQTGTVHYYSGGNGARIAKGQQHGHSTRLRPTRTGGFACPATDPRRARLERLTAGAGRRLGSLQIPVASQRERSQDCPSLSL